MQREQALQNFQLQQLEREQAYQQEREALIREREQELAITNRAYAARLRMEAEYANQIMAIGQRIQSSAGGIGTATNSGSKGFTQSGLAGTSGRGGSSAANVTMVIQGDGLTVREVQRAVNKSNKNIMSGLNQAIRMAGA